LAKVSPENGAPVAVPVTQDERAIIAHALAEAAQALLKASNVLLGGQTAQIVQKFPFKNSPVASLPHFGFDRFTVREVINEFLIAKARANRSDRYLRQLRVSLSSFAQGRSNSPLDSVTVQEVEKWLYGLNLRPKTMRGYLGDVKTLFHFAHRRQYLPDCAAVSVELPASDTGHAAPCIHTPEQVKTVLEAARASNLDVCRHLAVRYFAGIRTAEAHRLREENILLDRGLIEVPAAKAKTRSRRLVKIQPCLAAWLALGGALRPMRPDTVRANIRASGVKWEPNVTRHSFVSYHLAQFESASKTALEAGHDEQMLFAHYRALVTLEAANRFWGIYPL
jgi:integrase